MSPKETHSDSSGSEYNSKKLVFELIRGLILVSRAAPLRRAIQHLHLSRKTKDNRLERSRGGVRPVAAADWSDTGYWTRLTPNPGNSLAFIVWNCCVGGELVQHSAHTTASSPSRALARGCTSSPGVSPHAVTRARNRVTIHASRGDRTVGAEFCAERQTIAAKWLNCSQLNKCFQPYLAAENGAPPRERGSSLLPSRPLSCPPFPFFPPL